MYCVKETTIMHAMFIDKIAFAYSVILGHDVHEG